MIDECQRLQILISVALKKLPSLVKMPPLQVAAHVTAPPRIHSRHQ